MPLPAPPPTLLRSLRLKAERSMEPHSLQLLRQEYPLHSPKERSPVLPQPPASLPLPLHSA
ncbi:hypothetical protein YH65_00550 [Sulfurovum lithotrophicum]|uniref:Uncharacterized protein n=1 Tax=Sulfurovum lithotrophicum TaxID=206403 RepID=A0A7U4LZJ7_9BACT|nr:hypothetical protein YH65_00550 [Sulfurovum lithotrophicum]